MVRSRNELVGFSCLIFLGGWNCVLEIIGFRVIKLSRLRERQDREETEETGEKYSISEDKEEPQDEVTEWGMERYGFQGGDVLEEYKAPDVALTKATQGEWR